MLRSTFQTIICQLITISYHSNRPTQFGPSLQAQTRSRYVLDYPKAKYMYDAICSYLLDYDFTSCLQSQDAEDIWTIIKKAIYEGMFITKVRTRHYQYPCWFTSELRHISKCLRTLRKRTFKHPSPYLHSKIVAQESDLWEKIQHAKSYYEAQIVRSFSWLPQFQDL